MNGKLELSKPMRIMLLSMGILFGSIFFYKLVMMVVGKIVMSLHGNPIVTVSATTVGYQEWQPEVTAVGSLRAVVGVNVTCELAGMIRSLHFVPGSDVKEGDLLVQLNADPEVAQLHALEANAWIAKVTYERNKAQYGVKAISKETLDRNDADWQSAQAQVDQQAAVVLKKSVRAPFTGRLGICQVNPGQYINPGDVVTTLQTLNPIYADFYLPQQLLSEVKVGQLVTLKTDAFPNNMFTGKITTVNPAVQVNSRNVEVEATFENLNDELTPGMFVDLKVDTGTPKRYLTLPQTAVTFNPYGNIVYLVKTPPGKNKKYKLKNKKGTVPVYIVEQHFVKTGETRGDQVVLLGGIKEGDEVVTSGQVKLKNGTWVVINNSVIPGDAANTSFVDK
ncbi:MAG: efflux transporter periplasmic adaptor subunit [Gammaproteobacteria bacterium RIFCSPLOWO2_12_FULL_38_14]|nr:MAG: efflux transporter periplasmic adaptor subunit [Gammaproteobacteria bacterium RIFCSPHIGHO2_02_FULL_38_33]OGT23468.1 MAG: efflux transporter periplasmic adaptor subunit [Gammaproteobacteria bacterium RIFCSPHIGHO2_12_38_15]OGT77539.1 MAG: efflux transporter periplasmic adaptor subunit [Gammaproteobacteria bacterium RIFCSPLOWO2_12_FULL_38_14]